MPAIRCTAGACLLGSLLAWVCLPGSAQGLFVHQSTPQQLVSPNQTTMMASAGQMAVAMLDTPDT